MKPLRLHSDTTFATGLSYMRQWDYTMCEVIVCIVRLDTKLHANPKIKSKLEVTKTEVKSDV